MNKKVIFNWLDVAKGLGIIMVVIGHTIFPCHAGISLFHMPLFFFIAGLTLKPKQDIGLFLLKKVDRIFIPYLFFSIVSFLIMRLLGYSGIDFNGPLWFLQTLFVSLLLCELLVSNIGKLSILILISVIFAVYSSFCQHYSDSLFPFDADFNQAIKASTFILIGYIIKDFIFDYRSEKYNLISFVFLLILFGGLCYIDIVILGANGIYAHGDIMEFNYVLFYLTAMAGVFMTIFISKLLSNVKILAWLGNNSLVIMCVHYPFSEWWNSFISSTSFYSNGTIFDRGMIAVLSYLAIFAFTIPFILVCKKYFPSFTGYDHLLVKNKD